MSFYGKRTPGQLQFEEIHKSSQIGLVFHSLKSKKENQIQTAVWMLHV